MTLIDPEEADQVEQHLVAAPGAKRMTPVDTKLTRADKRIKQCAWCGAGTMHTHCTHCRENGYPRISE